MFNLSRSERVAVCLLTIGLFAGLTSLFYAKSHPAINIEIKRFATGEDEKEDLRADLLIQRKININEAGPAELAQLKGVGDTMARRIVAYRDSNGRFANVNDITKVKGIGKVIFEKIKDRISIE